MEIFRADSATFNSDHVEIVETETLRKMDLINCIFRFFKLNLKISYVITICGSELLTIKVIYS